MNQIINQVFVDIEIGSKKIPVSFKLDTGAQVNVIPLHVFHQLECNNLESTTHRLFGYGRKTPQGGRKLHFSLFIQRNTGATPFLCSVYASTPNTGTIIMLITKSDITSTLCRRKTGW